MEIKLLTEIPEMLRYGFEVLYGKKPNLILYFIEIVAIAIVVTLVSGLLVLGIDFFTFDLGGSSPFRYSLFCLLGVNGWFFFYRAKLYRFDEEKRLEIPLLHIQALGLNLISPVLIVFVFYVIVKLS